MKFVRRTFGKSYDEWFAARTPATGVQFVGLLLLGAMLIACGMSVLVLMWSKGLSDPVDGFVIVLLSMCSIPGLAMIYFGAIHIKRALAGILRQFRAEADRRQQVSRLWLSSVQSHDRRV